MLYPSENIIRRYLENILPDFEEKTGGEFVGPAKGYEKGEHFWINVNTGLWQDFKNKETGNFWMLISYIEDCSVGEAQKNFLKHITSHDIKGLLNDTPKEKKETYKPVDFFDILDLVPITPASLQDDPRMFRVKEFIEKKRLKETLTREFPLYLSIGYDYPNTIIIPFIEDGKMVFFQARSLDPFAKAKYLTPREEDFNVKSSNILYPFKRFEKVWVTEGPLKARILQYCGFNATSTQGASLSLQQARLLKTHYSSHGNIVIAYDADKPGIKGANKAFNMLVGKMGCMPSRIYMAPIPGEGLNDWDDVYVEDPELIKNSTHCPYMHWKVTVGSGG